MALEGCALSLGIDLWFARVVGRMNTDHVVPRRGWLALGAGLSLLFVAYGSLVPFDRNGVGLDVAMASFELIREAGFLAGSRVDFGSNVLLMAPAGFFLAGLTWSRTHPALNVAGALASVTLCLAVSISVEFLQLFFHSRSTAYSDIVAQAIGAVVGMGGWWLWGRRVWPRYFRAVGTHPGDVHAQLLIIYLAAMLLYQLTPLDITVHPGDLVEKWQLGRIGLWPRFPAGTGITVLAYEVFADLIAWAPLGYLLLNTRRYPVTSVIAASTLIIAAVEVLQLLVFSRHTTATDIVFGSAGAAAGCWIARLQLARSGRALPHPRSVGAGQRVLPMLLAVLAWFAGLCCVFWYPFDLHVERAFFNERVQAFFSLPLESYYRASILGATSSVFRKAALFVPIGIGLAYLVAQLRAPRARCGAKLAAVVAAAAGALVVEVGQLLLVSKVPRLSDAVFMFAGAIVGYAAALRVFAARPAGARD